MTSIRLLLPPLRALAPDIPLAVAVGAKTAWHRHAPLSLAELGRRWPGAKVTAFLHPEDLTLTAVPLPPLPRARLRIAVQGAIEPLVLGDTDSLRIGHGARGADGRVPVGWLDADAAHALQARIAACGLTPAAFAPASLWLPETARGWTLWQRDGYLIVRQADGAGASYALDDGNPAAQGMGADAHACALAPRQWIGARPAWWQPPAAQASASGACDSVLPEAACGVMTALPWSLPAAAPEGAASAGWRAAIALAAAAALVWMGGLGLYAGRLERAAQDARQHLAQAVRDTFPAVGAVVDPVGQARRQLALRQEGGDDWAELGLLLRAASEHMAFAAGEVQAWRYEAGALELDLPPAARPRLAADTDTDAAQAAAPAWVQAARQGGVEIQATSAGWRLRRAPPPAGAKAAQRS